MTIVGSALSQDEWKVCMDQDGLLKKVKKYIVSGWPQKCKDFEQDIRDYWEVRYELNLQVDKVLRNDKIIPAEVLRSKI